MPVTVGAGGEGSPSNAIYGNILSGSATSVEDICSAAGGWSGASNVHTGGDGGSGGGCAQVYIFAGWVQGMPGGKDGSDGGSTNYANGGKGQGTTTRYFGESTGTLYASGGSGRYRIEAGFAGANTGDGGSVTPVIKDSNGNFSGSFRFGGSGIAIIRWGK